MLDNLILGELDKLVKCNVIKVKMSQDRNEIYIIINWSSYILQFYMNYCIICTLYVKIFIKFICYYFWPNNIIIKYSFIDSI